MNIECPKCSQANEIECAEHISCQQCKTHFKGMSFVKKTLTKTAAIGALSIGAIGGYEVNDAFDGIGSSSEHRYPLDIEFALVDTCINNRSTFYSVDYYEKVRQQCLCAIETTTKEVSYHQYQNNIVEFKDAIQYSIQRCKN